MDLFLPKLNLLRSILFFAFSGISFNSYSQEPVNEKDISISPQLLQKFSGKATLLTEKLKKKANSILTNTLKKEKRLKAGLAKIDSAKAEELFGNIDSEYREQERSIQNPQAVAQYIPSLDSAITSVKFLQQHPQLLPALNNAQEKAGKTLSDLNQLQAGLQQSQQIKKFLQQRQELIRQTLASYTQLPKSLALYSKQISKQVYYYSQQVNEYRALLNDPDRLVKKTLQLLSRTNAFQQFMKKNSQLALLFQLPADYGNMAAMPGMQTRSQIQQLIQQQVSAAGPNAQDMIQQNLDAAQQQLTKLKDKFNNGGSENVPDFKPNNQKVKSFWKRLEYGTNFQTSKSGNFFPSTSDIGLSIGYKLNDKSVIGIGGSYKMGWGRDIRNISFTSEGASLRSFLDIQLKGSFYAAGGFEYNYQPLRPGAQIPAANLPYYNAWTQSGLVGISKVISLRSKFFKKTRLQLSWDFLSYQQTPRTEPVRFRAGYNF